MKMPDNYHTTITQATHVAISTAQLHTPPLITNISLLKNSNT